MHRCQLMNINCLCKWKKKVSMHKDTFHVRNIQLFPDFHLVEWFIFQVLGNDKDYKHILKVNIKKISGKKHLAVTSAKKLISYGLLWRILSAPFLADMLPILSLIEYDMDQVWYQCKTVLLVKHLYAWNPKNNLKKKLCLRKWISKEHSL